jgi:hypothetical protein
VYLTHPEKPILEASLAEYLHVMESTLLSSHLFLFLFFFSSFSFFQVIFSDCKNPCKISKMREFFLKNGG